MENKIYKLTNKEFIDLVKSSLNTSEVLFKLRDSKSNQKYIIQYDSNMQEIKRFGTIEECCEYLMKNNLVTTKIIKNLYKYFSKKHR